MGSHLNSIRIFSSILISFLMTFGANSKLSHADCHKLTIVTLGNLQNACIQHLGYILDTN